MWKKIWKILTNGKIAYAGRILFTIYLLYLSYFETGPATVIILALIAIRIEVEEYFTKELIDLNRDLAKILQKTTVQ